MDKSASGVVRHPDFEEIRRRAIFLNLGALNLRHNRPDCSLLKKKYDEVFNSYGGDIEELDEKRRVILKDLKGILESKGYNEWTQDAWQEYEAKLERWRVEHKRYSTRAVDELMAIFDDTKSAHEDFNESQIEEARKLERELGELEPILKTLRKSTHKWKPIEGSLAIRSGRIRGAEGSGEAPIHRKTEETEILAKLKCDRCQEERASAF